MPPSLAAQYHCARNPAAPCDVVEREGKSFVALTGRQTGTLKIVSVGSTAEYRELSVADHPLTNIRFSRDGELIATASERGTLIRIINVREGQVIGEFRRGSFQARIAWIGFAPGRKGMAVYSDKGTVHLFEIEEKETDKEQRRAVATWKLPGFQPAAVDFLGGDLAALVKFTSGEVEILKWDGAVVVSEASIVLADLQGG
jgi:WD40 repeat protein